MTAAIVYVFGFTLRTWSIGYDRIAAGVINFHLGPFWAQRTDRYAVRNHPCHVHSIWASQNRVWGFDMFEPPYSLLFGVELGTEEFFDVRVSLGFIHFVLSRDMRKNHWWAPAGLQRGRLPLISGLWKKK